MNKITFKQGEFDTGRFPMSSTSYYGLLTHNALEMPAFMR